MKKNVQWAALAVLVVVMVLVWVGPIGNSGGLGGVLGGPARIDRFIVPNPSLRLDLLEKISKLKYEGMQRNIFNASPLPRQQPPPTPAPPKIEDHGPPVPPPAPVEQPFVPPFKFYGYVVDARSGRQRGFFTNGDDIWVAAEGDFVQRRFKLVRLSKTGAEIEEVSSGKRATLPLDETAAPSGSSPG